MENVVNIEQELKNVKKEIKEIDAKISTLQYKKQELQTKQETLKSQQQLEKSTKLSKLDWNHENFPWSAKIKSLLESVFKITTFRSQQLQTINAIMSNHDILLLAPTGGGKSLTYQLPAISSDGITIVISPLISLMEDQVWALKKLGIEAEIICSKTEKETVNQVYKVLAEKSNKCSLKLLYVTPERLAKSKRFMTSLQKCYFAKKLERFAIDEVHCCSQWGHDFRPDYKFLGTLKNMFPDIPILGVTATATSKVITDVQKMLNIEDCLVLKAPFNRPNLFYQVLEKPSEKIAVYDLLEDLLKNRYSGKSGIIYTFSTKDADDISAELLKREVKVRPYHASLDSSERTKVHEKWIKNQIQAVVATVAFGMGIDKPDVRFVIHHTISKSMENFYQESGRAGRDGNTAECVLLYRFSDIFKVTTMMFTEYTGLKNAYAMIDYCINGTKCRRKLISKHFQEVWDSVDCKNMCDRCYYKDKFTPSAKEISNYCNELYQIIDKADGMDIKLTGLKLIDAWYHKGLVSMRNVKITPPKLDRHYGEQIIALLLTKGYLKEDFHYTPYATLSYIKKGNLILQENTEIVFNGARVLELPEKLPFSTDDDVIFVGGEVKIKIKKRRSSNDEKSSSKSKRKSESNKRDSTESEHRSKKGRNNSSDMDVSISESNCSFTGSERKRKKSKKSKNKLVDEIIEKETKKRKHSYNEDSDVCKIEPNSGDEVVLIQPSDEVIEIDD